MSFLVYLQNKITLIEKLFKTKNYCFDVNKTLSAQKTTKYITCKTSSSLLIIYDEVDILKINRLHAVIITS
jgi:hypothetical protein